MRASDTTTPPSPGKRGILWGGGVCAEVLTGTPGFNEASAFDGSRRWGEFSCAVESTFVIQRNGVGKSEGGKVARMPVDIWLHIMRS